VISNYPNNADPFTAAFAKTLETKFDSCVIVHDQYSPKELFDAIYYMLQPGAAFAVYSSFQQPLAEVAEDIIKQKKAVSVRLEELWMREHQVLPKRTHPTMSMHGASGFILSGIKCIH
jgi:tRNA (adenine-N(1)-)-methyltransferase non-catalytic subunit